MAELQTDQSRLDQLAEAFAERYRRGERPSISEYVREHPDLADQIEELFPALAMMEQVEHDLRHRATPSGVAASPEPSFTQLGDFRIIREVGRGGMGIVYEAEQVSLGRRVALKVLPKQTLLDSKYKSRFIREAKAAARLHHTNIVPVFGVGEQDGLHYYVMQFIYGLGLDEVLVELQRLREESLAEKAEGRERAEGQGSRGEDAVREASAAAVAESLISGRFEHTLLVESESEGTERPSHSNDPPSTAVGRLSQTHHGSGAFALPGQSEHTSHAHSRSVYWRSVARIGLETAQALQYAHDQGIIHRDIKPGNLLLDTRGGVWVTDFGLAKAADQQDLTHTGDVLGTLRYMAPEQFEGQADARSDVFSLGLTLYELLCLKPAFNETERHRLIKQVTTGTPPRLRSIDRTIPRDLETIVHKAIDRDPAHRYQTADELAADLQRYLGNEPIRAKWVSPVTRFSRWCKRNPAVASLTTTIAVLLAAAAAISSVAAVRYEKMRDDAVDAKAVEEDLKNKALAAERDANTQRGLAVERELLARRNLYAAHMNLAREAWDRGDVPRMLDLLERHIPAPGEPDWRSFEWYYLLGLCNQDELTINCGQSSLAPAFSPNGALLAVGIAGQQIELWDLEHRERKQDIVDPTCFGPLAFSPDGSTLASAGGGELKLWDVSSGELLRSIQAYRHSMAQVAFTPEGSRVISTDGGNMDTKNVPGVIRVWDVASGELVYELSGHAKYIESIAVSPDGSRLMSAGYGEVLFWDLSTGQLINGPGVRGEGVSWSREGGTLSTWSSGHVVVWDSVSGEVKMRMPSSHAFSTALSPDGTKVAAAVDDSTVRLWNVATGEELAVFRGHSQWVFHVIFSPDGRRLASVSRDMQVKVWPVEPANLTEFQSHSSHRRAPTAGRDRVRLSADGTLLAAVKGSSRVAIIEMGSGLTQSTLDIGADVNALSFSPDGRQLAVAHASGIQIWDLETSTRVDEHESDARVWTIDVSPDGMLLAAGTDARQVEIYRVTPLERVRVLPWAYSTAPGTVVFSNDGRRLGVSTIAEPLEAHVWSVDDWKLTCSLVPSTLRWSEEISATDLEFSPDDTVIAVSEGTRYQPREGAVTSLFDAVTGEELAILQGDDAFHAAHAFSQDGGTLVTGTEHGRITLWDLQTREERFTIQWDGHAIQTLALLPDGQTLISTDANSNVRFWRGAPRERVQQVERVGLFRRAREYAADGRWDEADALYTYLLEREDSLAVHMNRARTYAALNHWDEAIADFRYVADSGAGGIRPWYELALAELASGDEEAYRATCGEMLDLFQNTADPLTAEFVAWTHVLRPRADLDWGELLAFAARPLANPTAGAASRKNLGAVLLRAGLYEDALAELEAAVDDVRQEQERTSVEYNWYLLALAYAHLGNQEEAQSWLERAEAGVDESAGGLADGHSVGWFRQATLRLLEEETEAFLRSEADHPDDSEARDRRSQAAPAVYSRAIELSADVPELWRLRAGAYERVNRLTDAAADHERAEQLEDESELRRLTALVQLPGREEVAWGRNEFVYERASFRFENMSDYEGALADCVLVLRQNDAADYQRALRLYCQAQGALGTLEHADVEWFREFGSGQMDRFYKGRAEYLQESGKQVEAEADFARLEWGKRQAARDADWKRRHGEDLSADPWIHLIRARDHLLLDEDQQAEGELAAAVAAAENDADVWMSRVILFDLWGSRERAEADWQHVVELSPADTRPLILRGRWYAERGDYDHAAADLSAAASLTVRERRNVSQQEPSESEQPFVHARTLARQGRWADALALYAADIDKNRLNEELLEYAALLLLNRETQQYRDLCRSVTFRPAPETADARQQEDYFRAGILVLGLDNGLSPDDTLQFVNRAARSPDAATLAWLSMAYLRSGDPQVALHDLGQALQGHDAPLDEIAPLLALAHSRLGRDGDARLWGDAVLHLRQEFSADENQPGHEDLRAWLQFCLWSREVEIEFDPQSASPATLAELVQAADVSIRRGDAAQAAPLLLEAIDELGPEPGGGAAHLAHRIYAVLEDESLRTAVIDAAPDADRIWKNLAWHYTRTARWADAVRCYRQATIHFGEDAQDYAFVLALAGDTDGYREHCLAMHQEAAPIVPGGRAGRMVEMCIAGADSGIDPDEVLAWMEQMRPASGDVRWFDVIAPMVYYRAGQFDRAISAIPQENPEFGVHPFVCACAHFQLGEIAQAREWFETGVGQYAGPVQAARNGDANWFHNHWLNASLWYREAAQLLGEDPLDILEHEDPQPETEETN